MDEATAELLEGRPGLSLRPVPARAVRGIGVVRPVLLTRA